MITQFQGEDRREAIINHLGLNVEEEDDFFSFVEQMGYSIDSEDEVIENLHLMFTNTTQ